MSLCFQTVLASQTSYFQYCWKKPSLKSNGQRDCPVQKTGYCIYSYNLYTSAVKQDATESRLESSRVKSTSNQSLRNVGGFFMTAFVATFIFTNYKAIDTFQKHFLPCWKKNTHISACSGNPAMNMCIKCSEGCMRHIRNMEAKKHDG